MRRERKFSGFTLIELLVVIAIIALLASVILISLNSARAKARDAKRIPDIKQLVTALQFYYEENGVYPPVNAQSSGVGGWNVSYNPGFLQEVVDAGIISASPKDPINLLETGFTFFGPKAGSYFYAYYNYPAASAANYGCTFNSDFAVLAIRQLEGGRQPGMAGAQCGTFPQGGCTDGGISGVCRDWSTEFDYSVMLIK